MSSVSPSLQRGALLGVARRHRVGVVDRVDSALAPLGAQTDAIVLRALEFANGPRLADQIADGFGCRFAGDVRFVQSTVHDAFDSFLRAQLLQAVLFAIAVLVGILALPERHCLARCSSSHARKCLRPSFLNSKHKKSGSTVMTQARVGLVLGALLVMCVVTPAWSQSVDQTTTYYAHAVRGWRGTPTISILGSPGDRRAALVVRAVDFWNGHLEQIGSPFRLGSISYSSDTLPADYLQQRSQGMLDGTGGPPAPEALANSPGDIVVALSDAEFVSFSARVGSKMLVAIRNGDSYPLALPNVALNVITHELGHAIGLGHNNNPALLMCGRPATCRPDAFISDDEHIFPLSDVEDSILIDLYPPAQAPSSP